MKPTTDKEQYKHAIWDYIMEHSEIEENGTIFVKFHVTTKSKFFGHIIARVNGYHRENPDKKYLKALAKQNQHKQRCMDGQIKRQQKLQEENIEKQKQEKLQQSIRLVGILNNSPWFLKPFINYYGKNILKVF